MINEIRDLIPTQFASDDRGVSIPLEYAMGFMVLIIVSGIFTYGIIDIKDQQADMAVQQELERINNEVAHAIDQTDALAAQSHEQTGANQSTQVLVMLPDQVAGKDYAIRVNSTEHLIVKTDDIQTTTKISIQHANNVPVQHASDGDIIIVYDENGNGNINIKKP